MALPATLNPARPSGTDAVNDPASTIDNQIRDLKQLIADIFGIPVDPTSITAASWSQTAAGVVSLAQPTTMRLIGVVDRTTTDVNVPAMTAETTIYSFSLPGGMLGTSSRVTAHLLGFLADPPGAPGTAVFRCKYGATTLTTDTITPVDNNRNEPFHLAFHLVGAGATNAQEGYYSMATSQSGFAHINQRGTSAIDSTISQTVLVSLATGANVDITIEYAWLEHQP